TPAGLVWPVSISHAMRVVSTRVLPLPAPARISADWCGSVTASSWRSLRPARKDGFTRELYSRALLLFRGYSRLLDAELVFLFLEFRGEYQRFLFAQQPGNAQPINDSFFFLHRPNVSRVTGVAEFVIDGEYLFLRFGRREI